MVSKQSQVINIMLSFFWWYVDFLSFIFFVFSFCFSKWSNFISCFISNQISIASGGFWTTRLEAVFAASIPVFVTASINFFTIFSCEWEKTIYFNVFSVLWFCWISHFYNVYPIISVIFTLSAISTGLLFWSVNHNWMDWNSALVVFSIINKWGEIVINSFSCLI